MLIRRCGAAVLVLSLLGLAACTPEPEPNAEVMQYFDEAVEILRTGIYATGDEWSQEVESARQSASRADSVADIYGLLGELTKKAGGTHSSFETPANTQRGEDAFINPGTFALPTAEVRGDVGILTLPSFAGVDAAAESYASAGVGAIQEHLSAVSCGWVLDLRDNAGGNAFAMMAAAAPLLSDAEVAGFAYPRGGTDWITVAGGRLAGYDTASLQVSKPVDVLTNQRTASAAELVAVGFNGQPDAARVGQATAGLTSSNVSHKLSDGASLLISVAWYVDRAQNEFTGPLQPDVEISLSPKAQLDKAVEDLRGRC